MPRFHGGSVSFASTRLRGGLALAELRVDAGSSGGLCPVFAAEACPTPPLDCVVAPGAAARVRVLRAGAGADTQGPGVSSSGFVCGGCVAWRRRSPAVPWEATCGPHTLHTRYVKSRWRVLRGEPRGTIAFLSRAERRNPGDPRLSSPVLRAGPRRGQSAPSRAARRTQTGQSALSRAARRTQTGQSVLSRAARRTQTGQSVLSTGSECPLDGRGEGKEGGEGQRGRVWRAMTRRWIWLVPSKIWVTLASRK